MMPEVDESVNGQRGQQSYDLLGILLKGIFQENPQARKDELVRQKIKDFEESAMHTPSKSAADVWVKLLCSAAMSVEYFASPGKEYFLTIQCLASALLRMKDSHRLERLNINWLNPEKVNENANLLSQKDVIDILVDLVTRDLYAELISSGNNWYISKLLNQIKLAEFAQERVSVNDLYLLGHMLWWDTVPYDDLKRLLMYMGALISHDGASSSGDPTQENTQMILDGMRK